MKARLLLPLIALLIGPLVSRADASADFERDAKPILARQPGLIDYIHAHFDVKESGLARVPGDGNAPPRPPFIFSARPKGHSGPFYLRLLIQPGAPGRILRVADIRKLPPGETPPGEETASAPPGEAPASSPTPSSPRPASPSTNPVGASTSAPASEPGSDTPSGPVNN
jgi:hypothetical protein